MSESKMLAKELIKYSNYENFERSGGSKKDYIEWENGEEIRILNHYRIHMVECTAIIIYKDFFPENISEFSKVIPSELDWEEDIEKVLDAQSWRCI